MSSVSENCLFQFIARKASLHASLAAVPLGFFLGSKKDFLTHMVLRRALIILLKKMKKIIRFGMENTNVFLRCQTNG